MKAQEQTSSVSKLVARFDNELKAIIMNDLNARNAKANLVDLIKQRIGNRLSAA